MFPTDVAAQIELALCLYRAGRARPSDEAAPMYREAIDRLDALAEAKTLPKANSNWAPFIQKQLDSRAP